MDKKIYKQLIFCGLSFNSLILISCVSQPKVKTFSHTFSCQQEPSLLENNYPLCSNTTEDDQFCQIKLENLKPTQFNFAEDYVKHNFKYFANKPVEYQNYLCKNPIEVVVGSKADSGFYVTDGHHRVKIIELFRSKLSQDFTIIAKIIKNYHLVSPNLKPNEFWNSMQADNFVYLKDKGVVKDANELPKSFLDMTNDPYLSLVSYIRDDKQKFCFDTQLSSFQNYGELHWAEYFRNYKGLDPYSDNKIYSYYKNRIIYFGGKNSEKKKNICKSLEAANLPGYFNSSKLTPTLVIDSFGATGEVKSFRTMSMLEKIPNINHRGLSKLKASGSAQFSESQLSWIKMNTSENLVVVDLRQESHGFINGNPVSWTARLNWANKGELKNNIIVDESVRLNELLFQDHIAMPTARNYKINNFKISDFIKLEIQSISREDEITEKNKIGYYRVTVSDHSKPSDDNVDDFLNFYRSLSDEQWVHFHCRAGKGRTTTFLAMYDMLKNANQVSFHEIIKRQSAVEPFYNLLDFKKGNKKTLKLDRYQFLKSFYLFAKDMQGGYKGTWKQWKAMNKVQ